MIQLYAQRATGYSATEREREMKYLPFEMSNRILFYSFEHIKSHRNQFFLSYRLLFAVSII